MKKKGVELSMNLVIVAAILLIVLVILIFLLTGNLGKFSERLDQTSEGKSCKDLGTSTNPCEPMLDCKEGYKQKIGIYKESKDNMLCCCKK